MGIFYIVCGSRIGLLELGGFCCLERKENGMGIRIYSVGIAFVFFCSFSGEKLFPKVHWVAIKIGCIYPIICV